MLAKKYRLGYYQLQKVLKQSKPFFSYSFTLKIGKNFFGQRFGIVISGKSVKNAVIRNAFRRAFYKHIQESEFFTQKQFFGDFVFVVKSKTVLELNENKKVPKNFFDEIDFLLKKILKSGQKNVKK